MINVYHLFFQLMQEKGIKNKEDEITEIAERIAQLDKELTELRNSQEDVNNLDQQKNELQAEKKQLDNDLAQEWKNIKNHEDVKNLILQKEDLYKEVNSNLKSIISADKNSSTNVKKLCKLFDQGLDFADPFCAKSTFLWKADVGTMIKSIMVNLALEQLENSKAILLTNNNEEKWQEIRSNFIPKIGMHAIAVLSDNKWGDREKLNKLLKDVLSTSKVEINEEDLGRVVEILSVNPLDSLERVPLVLDMLNSKYFWQTLSVVKPKLLYLMAVRRGYLDVKLNEFITTLGGEKSLKNTNLVKLLLSNQVGLDGLGEVFSQEIQEAMQDFVKNSFAVQRLVNENGINRETSDKIVGSVLGFLPTLIPKCSKFLGFIEAAEVFNTLSDKSFEDFDEDEISKEVKKHEVITDKIFSAVIELLNDKELMSEAANKFNSVILSNSTTIAKILQDHSELYKGFIRDSILGLKYGFIQSFELERGQIASIIDDAHKIIKSIGIDTRMLLVEHKEQMFQIANRIIMRQVKNDGMIERSRLEKSSVVNLIEDSVPIINDIFLFALEDGNLETVQKNIISKLHILISETTTDKEKTDTLFEVIDSLCQLLSQRGMSQIYTQKIVPLLKKHRETLVLLIEDGIEQKLVKKKVKINAEELLDFISDPKTIKIAYSAYKDWRKGKSISVYLRIVIGIKKLRDVVFSTLFQEYLIPNFVRRHYANRTINECIKKGMEGVGVRRKSLSEIFRNAANSESSRIAKYSLKNNFCEGLRFNGLNFINLEINEFNFQKATFLANVKGELSFANSVIQKTDFRKVVFKADVVDLSNVTIDKSSLKSLLPSLNKAKKAGKVVSMKKLKLTSLELNEQDIQEFRKLGLTDKMITDIKENTKVEILMKQVRNYFKEVDTSETQFEKAEINMRHIVTQIVKDDVEFSRFSYPKSFTSFLEKLTKNDKIDLLFLENFNKQDLYNEIKHNIKITDFLKEFKQSDYYRKR